MWSIYSILFVDSISIEPFQIDFINNDTCFSLKQASNGDYYCDFLSDKNILYYPDNYNLVCLFCEPQNQENELIIKLLNDMPYGQSKRRWF